jgi:hypothetical protein
VGAYKMTPLTLVAVPLRQHHPLQDVARDGGVVLLHIEHKQQDQTGQDSEEGLSLGRDDGTLTDPHSKGRPIMGYGDGTGPHSKDRPTLGEDDWTSD